LDLLDRVLIESDYERFFAFWLAECLKVLTSLRLIGEDKAATDELCN
jgi:hypothetical protein